MNTFTVAAWVKVADKSGNRGILGTRFNGENTFDLKVDAARIHGDIGNGTAWLNTAVDVVTARGGSLTVGVWHHIAYAIDDATDTAKLYLDGALATTVDLHRHAAVHEDRPGTAHRQFLPHRVHARPDRRRADLQPRPVRGRGGGPRRTAGTGVRRRLRSVVHNEQAVH